MDDKKGLQTLINETIKVLQIARPLLTIVLIFCGIMLVTTAIATIVALPRLFAMLGK